MRHRLLFALAGGAALASCEVQPRIPELRHELNEPYIAANDEALAEDGVALDHLHGALKMLFGTPSHPGYFRVEEWIDEEHDPNWASLELSDEEWQELVDANREDFARQLEHVEAGRYDEVRVPSEKLRLAEDWHDLLDGWNEVREAVERGEAAEDELAAYVDETKEDARYLFEDWYPTLRESAEMYRVHCMHCHGVSGGGNGTTSEFLEPRPRDYRRGMFKYTALADRARPRRADLLNVLEQGIYATAMPNFARMTPAELNGLVDYVRLLSIRGETEIRLVAEYDEAEGGFPIETVKETYLDVWELWDEAAEHVIAYDGEVPRPTPESIARGKELFHDPATANCVSCHGESGRGDGPSAFETNAEGELVRVEDDWGHPISPRDLNRGLYRFGGRPIDIFRRIHAGINGTPMPSHAAMKDPDDPSQRLLSDEDLWSIVHYVRSLPASREVAAKSEAVAQATEGQYPAGQSPEGTH